MVYKTKVRLTAGEEPVSGNRYSVTGREHHRLPITKNRLPNTGHWSLILLLLLSSCTTDLEKIKKISVESETISEKGEDVEIHYSVQGHLKAKIVAPVVNNHQSEDGFNEFPNGVKLYSYDDAMKTTSTLTAAYGVYYPKKEEMMVRDNVVIVNIKGEMLNTEELTWKRKEEKIYSDKFVRITTPEEIIYGTGFEAKQDFSDYIIKNISGTIQVEDGGMLSPGEKGL